MRAIYALIDTILAAGTVGASSPHGHRDTPKVPAFVLDFGESTPFHASFFIHI